jgi:hypothetical protein
MSKGTSSSNLKVGGAPRSAGLGPIILPNIAIVWSNDPFDSNRIQ